MNESVKAAYREIERQRREERSRFYSPEEMAKRYADVDTIMFANGEYVMSAERAYHFCHGLVEINLATRKYRRATDDPSLERIRITSVLQRQRSGPMPSPWSSSR